MPCLILACGVCWSETVPNLHTLVLSNNRLVNLAEIDPLAYLPKLRVLSLLDNTVTKKPNYRLYVIHKLTSLRVLDFKKVKAKERAEAEAFFRAPREAEAETVMKEEEQQQEEEATAAAETHSKVAAPTTEQITAIKVP